MTREELERLVSQRLAAIEERLRAEARAEAERQAEEMARAFALAEAVEETAERVDGLVRAGKLPPALAPVARALLIAALGIEGEARAYAADDIGEHGGKSIYQLVNELLDGLPGYFEGAEQPKADVRRPNPARAYMAGDLAASRELYRRIRELQQAQPGLSFYEAYKLALKEE